MVLIQNFKPKSNSTLKQELTVTLQVPRHYSFQEVSFVVESSISSWAFNFSIILLLVSLRNNWHSYKTKMTETSRTVALNFELFVPLHYQYLRKWQIWTFSLQKYTITKFYMHIVEIQWLPESFHCTLKTPT